MQRFMRTSLLECSHTMRRQIQIYNPLTVYSPLSLSPFVSYQILLTQPVKLLEFLRHEQLSTSHCTSDFA